MGPSSHYSIPRTGAVHTRDCSTNNTNRNRILRRTAQYKKGLAVCCASFPPFFPKFQLPSRQSSNDGKCRPISSVFTSSRKFGRSVIYFCIELSLPPPPKKGKKKKIIKKKKKKFFLERQKRSTNLGGL